MSIPNVQMDRLDHFALTVRDVEQTCVFYEKVFGMAREPFGDNRLALRFGHHRINVNPSSSGLARKAAVPVPGSAEFCLVAEGPLNDFMQHLEGCGIEIEYGPAEAQGAEGTIRSVCFRDPDGNLIEVASYDLD